MIRRIATRRQRSTRDWRSCCAFSTRAPVCAPPSPPDLVGTPYRIGVVGGGPAGFYAASRLLGIAGADRVEVDLFELLPTPFGLARFGVAPDHPEVKNCQHKFEETARDPRFRYFGNVQVCGTPPSSSSSTTTTSSPSSSTVVPNLSPSTLAVQVPLDDLRAHYDAVLLTYGASLDRPLGVPGEYSLANVVSARNFVNWYNGHPHQHDPSGTAPVDLSQVRHVTIVGQGNVALDVARVLLRPVDALREFDVPDSVLAALGRSAVERVEVVGRRGVAQLAATTKELRELLALERVAFDPPVDANLLGDAELAVAQMAQADARPKKRALGLLAKGSAATPAAADKSWSLEFLKSPKALLGASAAAASSSSSSSSSSLESAPVSFDSLARPPERVGSIVYDVNELVPGPPGSGSRPADVAARATGRTVRVETDAVFKSVGYRSIGLPGLPFDERKGVVRNVDGRVTDDEGNTVRGLYTSGWLARGPNGVIATTMFNAFATADLIASDLASSSSSSSAGPPRRRRREDVDTMLERARGSKQVVTWAAWERIDQLERERGRARGKVREKMTTVEEMLRVVE
ncbi:hypothetical protein JCM11491_002707 [Sporobolomyces phaffii]